MVPEIGNRKALQEKRLRPLCVVSCVVQNLVYTQVMEILIAIAWIAFLVFVVSKDKESVALYLWLLLPVLTAIGLLFRP